MVDVAAGRFGIGSVIGRGFGVLFRNIVPFGVLALVVTSPTYIYAIATAGSPFAMAGEQIVLWIVQVLLTYVVTAALVYGTFQDLRGQHRGIGDIVGRGLSTMLPVIGVAILVFICFFIGFILLFVPGVFVAIVLWVAIPVAVVERPGVFASLSRSAELTKGFRWRILAVVVILFVIQLLINTVAGFVFGFSVVASGGSGLSIVPLWVLQAFTTALYAVVGTVGYHDLRVRKEGVDVEELAAVFD